MEGSRDRVIMSSEDKGDTSPRWHAPCGAGNVTRIHLPLAAVGIAFLPEGSTERRRCRGETRQCCWRGRSRGCQRRDKVRKLLSTGWSPSSVEDSSCHRCRDAERRGGPGAAQGRPGQREGRGGGGGGPRPTDISASTLDLGEPGIAWHGRLDMAIEEAQRTNRPIFFMAAASQCNGVPGVF